MELQIELDANTGKCLAEEMKVVSNTSFET